MLAVSRCLCEVNQPERRTNSSKLEHRVKRAFRPLVWSKESRLVARAFAPLYPGKGWRAAASRPPLSVKAWRSSGHGLFWVTATDVPVGE